MPTLGSNEQDSLSGEADILGGDSVGNLFPKMDHSVNLPDILEHYETRRGFIKKFVTASSLFPLLNITRYSFGKKEKAGEEGLSVSGFYIYPRSSEVSADIYADCKEELVEAISKLPPNMGSLVTSFFDPGVTFDPGYESYKVSIGSTQSPYVSIEKRIEVEDFRTNPPVKIPVDALTYPNLGIGMTYQKGRVAALFYHELGHIIHFLYGAPQINYDESTYTGSEYSFHGKDGRFLTPYASMGRIEDAACSIGYMFTNPGEFLRVLDSEKTELSIKFEMVLAMLSNVTGGLINRTYLRDLSQGDVNEDYWVNKRVSERTSARNLLFFVTNLTSKQGDGELPTLIIENPEGFVPAESRFSQFNGFTFSESPEINLTFELDSSDAGSRSVKVLRNGQDSGLSFDFTENYASTILFRTLSSLHVLSFRNNKGVLEFQILDQRNIV